MQSNGRTRRKRAQVNVSIMTTNEKYAHANTRKRGKRNGHARISAGGEVDCTKTETDADCLNCPNGFDDDEGVYCGVITDGRTGEPDPIKQAFKGTAKANTEKRR